MKTMNLLTEKEPEWLVERKNSAQEQFHHLPLPLYKYGLGIALDLRTFDPALLHDVDHSPPVIEAPQQVAIFLEQEALQRFDAEIKSWLTEEEIKTKFDAFHAAHATTVMITIPENIQLKESIVITTELEKTKCESLFFHIGKNSIVTIHDTTTASHTAVFHSKRVFLFLEEGVQVTYTTAQQLQEKTYQLQKKHSKLSKGSVLRWIEYIQGGNITQSLTKTELNAPHAVVTSRSLILGNKEQCTDVYTEALHNASATTSNLQTRTVLDEQARAIYRGLVKIQKNAQNCKGYQGDDVLLLSEDARADTVPNLEIHNDAVQCQHSATIAHLDEEQLFYLTTRGLTEEKAKQLLIEGFIEPFLSILPEENQQQIKNKLTQ